MSVKVNSMNDRDIGIGSSGHEDNCKNNSSQPGASGHKSYIKLPKTNCRKCVTCPLVTIYVKDNPDSCCSQLKNIIKMKISSRLGDGVINEKDKHAEHKKVAQYLITKKTPPKIDIPLTPHTRWTSKHHPCYIKDNVEQVMSFLSLIEILNAKRVSTLWQIAANATLGRRTVVDLTKHPLPTAEARSMMLRQIHVYLPKLLSLTLNANHFKHVKGLVFTYICECKNLIFLRVEKLD